MKYCLLGKTLSHSYSCDIHKEFGLDYSLKEIKENELANFFERCEYDGFNITFPYKKKIIQYLDYISPLAKEIGVVNTVLNDNGKLFGFNSDYFGIEKTFKHYKVCVKNKKVLILGNGATAQTLKKYLFDNYVKEIKIVSRTGEINYDNVYELGKDFEIIINATPVGSINDYHKIIDVSKFDGIHFIFDLNYNPLFSPLVLDAKRLKIKSANGLYMLVSQAINSEFIWTKKNRFNKIDRIYKNLLKQKLNIVLIGMPSCGKTTIGKELAKTLCKQFIDIDFEIEKKYDFPKNLIKKYGEQKFRDIESEIINDISVCRGAVISTGGGCVKDKKNMDLLKRNSIIIYIKRNLELLDIKNRPISSEKGIKELFNERKCLYESYCDFEVDNIKIKNVVKRIKKIYENIDY